MKSNIFIFLIIIFLHFSIIHISDFEITLGYLLFLFLPLLIFKKITFNKRIIVLYLIYLLIEISKFIILSKLELSFIDFIKSHLQIFLFITYLSIFVSSSIKKDIFLNFDIFLRQIGIIILISIIFQAIGFFFLNGSFSNLFGEYQWKYNLFSENFRAKSFYLEPSFLSLVLNILLFGDLILNKKLFLIDTYRLSIILGVIASASLFGLLLTLIIFIFYTKIYLRKKSIKYLIFIIIPSLFILIYLGLFNRLNELTLVNTSGYERVIFPILLFLFMFNKLDYYFGIPISGDFNLSKLASIDILVLNETVQNGLFLLIINLGLFFIPCLFFYLKKINNTSNLNLKFYLIILPIMLFNSGGLYALYYSIFTIFLPILFISIKSKDENITY